MEDRSYLIKYIKEKLIEFKELGKEYSEEKINTLADKLLSTGKGIEDLTRLIDNRFSRQIRKINHNKNLASLKEYYISSIDKLKKGNNCYLLSYTEVIKILEQAYIEEDKKINENISLVTINKDKQGYKKSNDLDNNYELIMSDVSYILNLSYSKTYRVFDKEMNPCGVINESFVKKNEHFLTLEETLQFIKEESPKFTLKSELQEYHDRNIKKGLRKTKDKKDYKDNIEYVLKLFKALPDITDKNYNELTKSYLNIKLFDLLTNSIDGNLNNIGIIINKSDKKYSYRLSPSYNKSIIKNDKINSNECICNFYIVEKKELIHTIISSYYKDVKELATLIIDNKKTLINIIDQIIKEHLEYDEFNEYHSLIQNNIEMINEELLLKKLVSPDTEEDINMYEVNEEKFNERIAPYVESYEVEETLDEKGSAALVAVVATVLIITIVLILFAIIAISKVEM